MNKRVSKIIEFNSYFTSASWGVSDRYNKWIKDMQSKFKNFSIDRSTTYNLHNGFTNEVIGSSIEVHYSYDNLENKDTINKNKAVYTTV